MRSIHIIAIDSGNDPHALRHAAESWGATVTATWVGNSDHVVNYLGGSPTDDIIIISGHGDSGSLLLPELDESIRNNYRYNGQITAEQFKEFTNLKQSHVINLACDSGSRELADAFLSNGAVTYIGPLSSPDGSAALMYAIELLYGNIVENKSITEAHQSASSHDDDRSMFKIYRIEHEA